MENSAYRSFAKGDETFKTLIFVSVVMINVAFWAVWAHRFSNVLVR